MRSISKPWLSPAEVAQLWGESRSAVYLRLADGELTAFLLRSVWRISAASAAAARPELTLAVLAPLVPGRSYLVREVAERWSVSPASVRRELEAHRLHAIRRRGVLRIGAEAILAYERDACAAARARAL